jgi:hypothetical protein
VAIVPRELCELLSPIVSLKTVRLPKAIPAITIRQYWHPRIASDPSAKFLRELIFEVASESHTYDVVAPVKQSRGRHSPLP